MAVITSTSGTARPPALSRSAARCSTPKRCCSSTTTTPRLSNATPSWISACVPIAMSTLPSARPCEHVLALGAGDPVGQQLDPQRPVAEQVAGIGDRDAVEHPPHARSRAARRAPRSAPSARPGDRPAPTSASRSPRRASCRRRRRPAAGGASDAGRRGRPRSRRSCARCAPVSSYGNAAYSRPTSSPAMSWRMPRDSRSSARLRITSTVWTRSSSSNASRRRARDWSAIVSGRWISRSASLRVDEVVTRSHGVGDRVGEAAHPAPLERVLDEPGDLPRVERRPSRSAGRSARSARCGRRSGRRSGSSSAVRRGTRPACRTARSAGPRCSCFSRHGWLKNVTVSRPLPSPTTALTIVRRFLRDPLRHRCAPTRGPAPRGRRRDRRRAPRSSGRPSVVDRRSAGRAPSRCRTRAARRASSRRRPSAGRPAISSRSTQRQRLHEVDHSLDAEQVRVERLAAVVHLDLDIGPSLRRATRRSRPCARRSRSSPVTTVTSSCSGVDESVEQPRRRRRPESRRLATIPSPRTRPIQSPAETGPASLAASRTAVVTSPVDDGLRCVRPSRSAFVGSAAPPGRRRRARRGLPASSGSARRAPSWW